MPADRHQSALGSAAAQCADAQALSAAAYGSAAIGPRARPDLSRRDARRRRRALNALHGGRMPSCEALRDAEAPDDHRRAGRAGAPRRRRGAGRGVAHWRQRSAALTPDWNGFNVLHRAAARVGGLDLGFVPGPEGAMSGILADARRATSRCSTCSAPTRSTRRDLGRTFVVYQGHHGDRARAAPMSSCRAPPIPRRTAPTSIPRVGCSWAPAVFPPGEAREDWKILRALRGSSAARCPSIRIASCARACSSRSTRCSAASAMLPRFGAPIRRPFGEAGAGRRGPSTSDRRFLPDRSDQPRQPDDGRSAARPSRRRRGAAAE